MKNMRKELQRIGFNPTGGQHFLDSETVIEALVKAGEVEDKTVLEIGPGTGAITEKLEEKAKKVYGIERDTSLSSFLEEKFSGKEKVEIVNGDFLEYCIPGEVDRCVSNLPFEISSDVLQKLGDEQIQSSLIVQDELAEKIIAEPGDSRYGEFTVRINYYFVPVKLRKVSSRNFYPEPEVDTAIVKLYPNKDRHGVENEEQFFHLTKALFTHKRKKVRNAFVDARNILEIGKDEAKEIRDQLPHSEKRVNQLEIIDLNKILEHLKSETDIL